MVVKIVYIYFKVCMLKQNFTKLKFWFCFQNCFIKQPQIYFLMVKFLKELAF